MAKYPLAKMYGRMAGWEADKLNEEQLKRKQQLCEEVNFSCLGFSCLTKRAFPGACRIGRDHARRESDAGSDAL